MARKSLQRTSRPKIKITKRTVDALVAAPDGKPFIAFDSELPGFGVRVFPSGTKTYIAQYRPGAGGRNMIARRIHNRRYQHADR